MTAQQQVVPLRTSVNLHSLKLLLTY